MHQALSGNLSGSYSRCLYNTLWWVLVVRTETQSSYLKRRDVWAWNWEAAENKDSSRAGGSLVGCRVSAPFSDHQLPPFPCGLFIHNFSHYVTCLPWIQLSNDTLLASASVAKHIWDSFIHTPKAGTLISSTYFFVPRHMSLSR